MSLITWARSELEGINFEPEGTETLIKVLEIFLEEFDSGGAVHAVIPILQSLLCGRPLRPLTGEVDEWFDPMGTPEKPGDWFQNKRCSSVFKTNIDIPHRGLKVGDAYDLDGPEAMKPIIFPYRPARRIPSPVMEVNIGD